MIAAAGRWRAVLCVFSFFIFEPLWNVTLWHSIPFYVWALSWAERPLSKTQARTCGVVNKVAAVLQFSAPLCPAGNSCGEVAFCMPLQRAAFFLCRKKAALCYSVNKLSRIPVLRGICKPLLISWLAVTLTFFFFPCILRQTGSMQVWCSDFTGSTLVMDQWRIAFITTAPPIFITTYQIISILHKQKH